MTNLDLQPSDKPTRREVLALAAGGAALAAFPTVATATPERVAEDIAKRFGSRPLVPGKIKLDLPPIVENGLVVPLSFHVESAMAGADFVKSVHLFADGNPSPGVATFHFSPLSAKAAASIRIRMAQTQSIVAVAEMASGELYTARREVKVVIGGCSG